MKGFYLEHPNSYEVKTLRLFANKHNYEIKWHKFNKNLPYDFDYVPYGDVSWFIKLTGMNPKPNYYPGFLSSYLGRKVWTIDTGWPYNQKVFIKPSDRYKRFTGFVTDGTYKGKKHGPYICSEVVQFTNEWRYYIVNGKILTAKWYIGSEEDKPAPLLNINWPSDFCGAVDFGEVGDKVLLVEAHHPFSCGWYGSINDNEEYGQWCISGWEYIKRLYRRIE
jgi:hypothetical protein